MRVKPHRRRTKYGTTEVSEHDRNINIVDKLKLSIKRPVPTLRIPNPNLEIGTISASVPRRLIGEAAYKILTADFSVERLVYAKNGILLFAFLGEDGFVKYPKKALSVLRKFKQGITEAHTHPCLRVDGYQKNFAFSSTDFQGFLMSAHLSKSIVYIESGIGYMMEKTQLTRVRYSNDIRREYLRWSDILYHAGVPEEDADLEALKRIAYKNKVNLYRFRWR